MSQLYIPSRTSRGQNLSPGFALFCFYTMPRYTYNGVTYTATRRRPSSRDDKKYMRTVTYKGDERLVHYGDPNMEMQRDDPERREAFLTRHSCDTKKDPFASGFWSCYDWENTDEKSEPMKSINHPLKVVDKTDDTLTVEGYIAIYGDEKRKDLDGEYFHEGTVFDSGYTKVNGLIVDWEHGQSPDMGEDGEDIDQPGRHDPLGMLDYTTARNDGVGLLARSVLNRREWYVRELVEPLAMAGMLGGSSEAIPGKVVKTGGRIDVWPLMRYALTVTPADPRQITEHQIQLVKSLANRYPALKALSEHTDLPASVNRQEETSADNTQETEGDNTPEPETNQEDVEPQAASAPATETSEAETDEGELSPEQELILLERVEALLRTIEEKL